MEIFVQLLVAGAVMGVLDFIWLGYVGKRLYDKEIGSILLEKPNMKAALIFYALYVIGTVVFVINPALANDSLTYAVGYGAFFGLVAYATYDLTSLAVLKGFTPKIVVIDLLWGAALTAVVSSVTFLVVSLWF
jgi:uncharacterized membrane protein